VSQPSNDELRQVLLDRLQRQLNVVRHARGMLDGQARDYQHLMKRIGLRITIARAEANIARIRRQL
jgi:hypothetical protein